MHGLESKYQLTVYLYHLFCEYLVLDLVTFVPKIYVMDPKLMLTFAFRKSRITIPQKEMSLHS